MNAPAWFNAREAATLPRMIIDSFAGGGGASTGIEAALGRSPDVAINHSTAALALHAANHPETIHLDSNIWDVKPREITRGRPVGLLWASPDCKHFSKAKGGAPRDRNIRDLAWVIVDWAEQVKPDVILMENVEEFVTWGPVDDDGQPVEWLKGKTFEDWKRRLQRAGYRIQHRELRACDYGAPTIRKRFFLVARCDGRRIVWPKPTHGDPRSPAVRKGRLQPWRTAAECIDWSLPCPSIFDTSAQIMAQHSLRAIRPLKPNTLARIARGIHRYVLQADRPFIVNLTHGGRVEDMAAPINTITGAHRGEKAVVVPSIVGCGGRAGQSRPRGGDEPLATVTAKADACVITPALTTYYGHGEGRGIRGADLNDPLRTVTVENRHSLLAPYLASIAHGDSGGRREYPLADPLGTVTVGGIQHALVTPILSQMYSSGGGHGATTRPHPAITAEGNHSSLVAPHLMTMRNSGKPFNGADEPTHTITAGGAGLSLVAPVLTYAQQGGGNRDPLAPHHTICASRKDQNSLIATFLAQQNTGVFARDVGNPISTICQTGSHQNPVAAFFAKYYGTGDGSRTDDPCHTVTVKDRFAHVQTDLAAPPFGPEHQDKARQVAHLLRDFGLWDEREFVTLAIDGTEFVIVDVGMRMLTPRELFRAQGFPLWQESYTFKGWRDQTIRPAEDQEPAFGKTDPARFAGHHFPWSSPYDQREHVAASARIDLGQRRLVVSSPERSPFAAPGATRSVSYPLPTEIADIARQLVQHRKMAAQTMGTGGAERPASGKPSTRQSLGAQLAMPSGGATAGHVADVDGRTNTQSVALRSTTSQAGPLSPICASILQTLSCYVAGVIASSTLGKTCQVSLFDIDLTIDASYVIEGVWQEADGDWAFRPFAKDVQVSCCGNSVCPPLAEALVRANCGHLREVG